MKQFLEDIYLDDSISGSQSLDGAFDFCLYVKILMKEGGFVLRKWTTNMPELQRKIDENEQFLGEEVESSDAIKSVLCVQWN